MSYPPLFKYQKVGDDEIEHSKRLEDSRIDCALDAKTYSLLPLRILFSSLKSNIKLLAYLLIISILAPTSFLKTLESKR